MALICDWKTLQCKDVPPLSLALGAYCVTICCFCAHFFFFHRHKQAAIVPCSAPFYHTPVELTGMCTVQNVRTGNVELDPKSKDSALGSEYYLNKLVLCTECSPVIWKCSNAHLKGVAPLHAISHGTLAYILVDPDKKIPI